METEYPFYAGTINAETYDTGVGRGGMGADADVPVPPSGV